MVHVSLIWAQSLSGIIGQGGDLPWHIPEDFAHFKALTSGGSVLMGRRTWESLPAKSRPLPGRTNIVVTRDPHFDAPGASVQTALTFPDGPVWVIGGGEIYSAAMPFADVLEVTEVEVDVDGDTWAPRIDLETFRVAAVSEWQTSRSGLRFRYLTYVRQP